LAGRLKTIGAEPVQVHRLRRWPPAPLAELNLQSSFDLEALRLEYPSDLVPDLDISTIEADPAFFVGYFTSASPAGSAFQLAQVELLFANLLSALPVTTAALGRIYGDRLMAAYYKDLARQGPVSRAALHSRRSVYETLAPYLRGWIANAEDLDDWQRVLLMGALAYELARNAFMAGEEDGSADAIVSGDGWSVFPIPINVVELLARLSNGLELSSDLCVSGYTAMKRSADGAVRGFALRESSMERARAHDAGLLALLESAHP
jgi:hypothetical protein